MKQIKVPSIDGKGEYYPVVWAGKGVCVIQMEGGFSITAINNGGCIATIKTTEQSSRSKAVWLAQKMDKDNCWQMLPVMYANLLTKDKELFGLPIIKEMCRKSLNCAAEQVKAIYKAGGF